jgi:hypothetical protein
VLGSKEGPDLPLELLDLLSSFVGRVGQHAAGQDFLCSFQLAVTYQGFVDGDVVQVSDCLQEKTI